MFLAKELFIAIKFCIIYRQVVTKFNATYNNSANTGNKTAQLLCFGTGIEVFKCFASYNFSSFKVKKNFR